MLALCESPNAAATPSKKDGTLFFAADALRLSDSVGSASQRTQTPKSVLGGSEMRAEALVRQDGMSQMLSLDDLRTKMKIVEAPR